MFPILGMMWGVPNRMAKALEIDEPPELFYVMRSICDCGKKWNEQTKIIYLAKNSREKLFYDTYPLNENVSRETFEVDILNHFLYRRIGFDTVTGFKIALITKLREIMPKYNLMFDLLFRDIFADSETESFNSRRDNEGGYEYRNQGGYQNDANSTDVGSDTERKNIAKTGVLTEDLRNSDTPQNRLSDVRSGEYVSTYDYNQRSNTESDIENSSLNSTKTGNANDVNTHNDTDTNHHIDTDIFTHEKIRKNMVGLLDKYGLLQEFSSIMGMIYKDLDCLFLGVFEY